MQIRVNRNIDNYKPDVFHGLDFSQTMHALGTVISGASAFLFANFYLHLPQTICLIDGMPPMEYLRRRKEIKRMTEYFYCPEPLSDFLQEEKTVPSQRMDQETKAEEVFLDDGM